MMRQFNSPAVVCRFNLVDTSLFEVIDGQKGDTVGPAKRESFRRFRRNCLLNLSVFSRFNRQFLLNLSYRRILPPLESATLLTELIQGRSGGWENCSGVCEICVGHGTRL